MYSYYYFSFPGQALGGEAVVKAKSEVDARDALIAVFPRVKPEDFKCDQIVVSRNGVQVIHAWDGDY